MRQPLEAGRKLGGHHLLAVEPTPVDDKGTVTDRVNHAPLLSPEINVGCDSLEHDDIVLGNNVDDLALNVGEALLDQGRFDDLGRYSRELEFGELVSIGTGARSNSHHLVKQVDSWNGDHALLRFS